MPRKKYGLEPDKVKNVSHVHSPDPIITKSHVAVAASSSGIISSLHPPGPFSMHVSDVSNLYHIRFIYSGSFYGSVSCALASVPVCFLAPPHPYLVLPQPPILIEGMSLPNKTPTIDIF